MTEVLFATPSLTHTVGLNYNNSVIETDRLMIINGIGVGYAQLAGDPYLWKVRSKLATMFLEDHPTATDLFFLDDDIGWPASKALEFLLREEDILVGVYPKKEDPVAFPVDLLAQDGMPIYNNTLVKIASAGFGFTRIKRHVLEALAKKTPKFKEQGSDREYFGFFVEGVIHGEAWGEDKYFYALAQQEGFEVWCDPHIPFSHQGRKKWNATLGEHLTQFSPLKELKE